MDTGANRQTCPKVRAKLDWYIDGELTTEGNIEVMEHVQHCTSCSREIAKSRELRTRLRAAVQKVSLPSGLESRLRDHLRHGIAQ